MSLSRGPVQVQLVSLGASSYSFVHHLTHNQPEPTLVLSGVYRWGITTDGFPRDSRTLTTPHPSSSVSSRLHTNGNECHNASLHTGRSFAAFDAAEGRV